MKIRNKHTHPWLAVPIVGVRIFAIHGIVVAVVGVEVGTIALRSPGPDRPATVILQKLPEGCIQPQAAVDSKGIVHLVYFKGKPEAGDLYYCHFPVSQGLAAASAPVRVNSTRDSAMATGTIRTEQIAVGQGDKVHVVWNGIGPKTPNGYNELFMAYTRINDSGTAFEPQRNLCQWTGNLDGGGSVAADREGNVYATWHTGPPNNKAGESARGVFVSISRDNGATFGREKMVNPDPTGACACCSMRAFVDQKGVVKVLYREAADGGTQRATMLLTSTDKGKSFTLRNLDPWPLNSCPMSSMSLAEDNGTTVAAWETRKQVFWAPITSDGKLARAGIVAPGTSESKHPIIVANGKGSVLFAWTEGTAWQRGGSLSWQMYDQSGRAVGARGHEDGVPVWSLLSGYTRPDGTFVILR
jgi:hypothetical protein